MTTRLWIIFLILIILGLIFAICITEPDTPSLYDKQAEDYQKMINAKQDKLK